MTKQIKDEQYKEQLKALRNIVKHDLDRIRAKYEHGKRIHLVDPVEGKEIIKEADKELLQHLKDFSRTYAQIDQLWDYFLK